MLVHLTPLGQRGLYYMNVVERGTDPDYGQGGGFRPDNSLPGFPGRPDNSLPGFPGRPDNSLPGGGWQGRPDNTLPGGGRPNFPDNTLPSGPPPHVQPGATLILVRDQAGVWHYAAIQPGQPVPPPLPDNTLPGGPPPRPGQGLPPTAQPKPV
jgi:hypothetical protein